MKKQRKLLKWIALLLCLMPWGLVRADGVRSTIYYAVPASVVDYGNYSVTLNIKYGSGEKEWIDPIPTMTKTDKTYYGNYIYEVSVDFPYGGYYNMEFLVNGSCANKVYEGKWNTDTKDGQMYDKNAGWRNYNYDRSITIHALKKDGWSNVYICNEFNDYGDHWDTEVTFPGSLGTQNSLNESWYDYTTSSNRPCTRVVTSNGYDGEGNRSGNAFPGEGSEFWITYDGTTTTCTSTPPSPWYIRDLGVSFEYNVHDWATYVSDVDLALPANVTAYTVSGVSGNTVTATSIGYIPANVPVLLNYSTGSSYGAISTTKAEAYTGTTDEFTSLLQGSATTTTDASGGGYILYNNKFVWCVPDVSTTLAAHRCWLPLSAVGSSGARELQIVTEGSEATGIREKVTVDSEKTAAAPVYNLAGQRVSQSTRGLYIVNGKKVVMK